MKYRTDKYGRKISQLGFGCMRFNGGINETARQIRYAVKHGINYFDTAYIYPGSEATLGKILEKYGLRDSVYIATKLPHYLVRSLDGAQKIFSEELSRLRTDHVDYYLLHMLSNTDAFERMRDIGVIGWLEDMKKSGRIGQIGFSYHGNTENFKKLIDAYDWDFCQIQYNYMDEHTQAGRAGLVYAHSKGIPVIIMEPLRGGKLVTHLPDRAKRIFDRYPVKHTPAEWSFRWLYDQEEVTCVLSGMNSMEMLRENLITAHKAGVGSMTVRDKKMLAAVSKAINAKLKVGCTGCGYCMPCPKGVDIRGTFAAYNRMYTESRFWGMMDYMICTALRPDSTGASNCIGCGKCERHCPQHIEIRKELENAKRELEGPLYGVVHKIAKAIKF